MLVDKVPAELGRSLVAAIRPRVVHAVAAAARQAMIVLRQRDNFRLPRRITTAKTVRRRPIPAGCSDPPSGTELAVILNLLRSARRTIPNSEQTTRYYIPIQ